MLFCVKFAARGWLFPLDGLDSQPARLVILQVTYLEWLHAPIAQLVEAVDLKSIQCRFEPGWGYSVLRGTQAIGLLKLTGYSDYRAIQIIGLFRLLGYSGYRATKANGVPSLTLD